MKEKRKPAKDGGGSTDVIVEMRKRYEVAVDADQENRVAAVEDLRFVTVPGHQWDEVQRKARKGRPCYEFPILRSHWRQVVNDQKKARPGIKVRAVENGDAKGAELRQGIIRNIESMSNAERAYDAAFESMSACGFGAWRVVTEYSQDDGWEQDIRVKRISDPLSSVWFDPDAKEADLRDAEYCFVEESISRDEYKRRYPKADVVDFESSKRWGYGDWYRENEVRIAEYWRKVPVTKELLLLSDGRTVDKAEVTDEMAARFLQDGIQITKVRKCETKKIVMSIVAGNEEIDGPHDSVFTRLPIIPVYANRHFIEGRWVWAGMVRFSRDPQKLLNYNLTTGQEVLSKQIKATPIVTTKMLEGAGVKQMWDASNAVNVPYLPITPDPQMPGGPTYLSAPPLHAAFAQFGQMAVDMLKASDGIQDASLGARSNETSGKAILARQQEGDTATFDYQDSLTFGIQATGEVILPALPKVYDTPRVMRVLGKDGGEEWVKLYEETPGGVVNDLSAGKYDVTVSTGPSYDTQRMEFVDALVQLSQGNELIGQAVPDLIVGAMDFPKAEEAAERLKMLLPPPIQQKLAEGKDLPPEIMQAKQQIEQQGQQLQQQAQMMQEAKMELDQQHAQNTSDRAAIDSQVKELQNQRDLMNAQFGQRKAEIDNMLLRASLSEATRAATQAQNETANEE